MKLSSCPVCDRLVRQPSSSCPFCGTRLGTTPALTRVMFTAVVGLALSGCVDKGNSETSAADGPGTAGTAGTGTATTEAPATSGFTDSATSSTPMTSSDGGHGFDSAGDTYTGPGIPPEETSTTGGTSSSGGDTEGSSGSGSDSGSSSGMGGG